MYDMFEGGPFLWGIGFNLRFALPESLSTPISEHNTAIMKRTFKLLGVQERQITMGWDLVYYGNSIVFPILVFILLLSWTRTCLPILILGGVLINVSLRFLTELN